MSDTTPTAPSILSHDELVGVAWRLMNTFYYSPGRLATFQPHTCVNHESPDVMAFECRPEETWQSVLFECKASRADFLADRKKPFRIDPTQGMGNVRIYVTNQGVVKDMSEIPQGWRWYEVVDQDNVIYRSCGTPAVCAEFPNRNFAAELNLFKYIYFWTKIKNYPCKAPRSAEGRDTYINTILP